jgi:hypothetical protein
LLRAYWLRNGPAIQCAATAVNDATNAKYQTDTLQKFDVPGTNYETVIGLAEIVPNVNIGRHTHAGPESGFMLEGDFVLLVEGQAPLPVKAGES